MLWLFTRLCLFWAVVLDPGYAFKSPGELSKTKQNKTNSIPRESDLIGHDLIGPQALAFSSSPDYNV